ncbi:hypothetical protein Y032_0031g2322 [Ancylostoma ceylanicum]|uniref:Uncharacterized protein n=1 Tax=Ancylostoma ceylanicum TaxID=53326 RepID=A0A016UQH8_9BILA|nr:hypothetical protein Y032_0031g2322 [Ancylostoma ceylanicum]
MRCACASELDVSLNCAVLLLYLEAPSHLKIFFLLEVLMYQESPVAAVHNDIRGSVQTYERTRLRDKFLRSLWAEPKRD